MLSPWNAPLSSKLPTLWRGGGFSVDHSGKPVWVLGGSQPWLRGRDLLSALSSGDLPETRSSALFLFPQSPLFLQLPRLSEAKKFNLLG